MQPAKCIFMGLDIFLNSSFKNSRTYLCFSSLLSVAVASGYRFERVKKQVKTTVGKKD